MGRTLDTLLHANKPGAEPVEATEALSSAAPEPDAPSPAEVPFIEVGGPGKVMEASPEVLQAGTGVPPTPVRSSKPQGLSGPHTLPLPLARPPSTARWTVALRTPAGVPPACVDPPSKRFATDLVAFHQPDHPAAIDYQSVLDGLAAQVVLGGSQVVLLTAATTGVGTTTVLLNLAITCASRGRRVAVVDANWRHPGLAARLGLSAGPGFQDVLQGRPLARALQETGQENLVALCLANTELGAAWYAGDRLRAVLRQLRRHVEWVFVDSPSWDGGPEMAALGSACDAVYLVVRPAEIEAASVTDLARLIPFIGSYLGGYLVTQR
jgi:Mrp family chromosome partitioning ATPase